MNITNKIKSLFLFSILIVVIFGGALFILSRMSMSNSGKVLESAKLKVIEKKKEMGYKSLRDQLTNNEDGSATLRDLLISEDNPVSFIELVENTARENNLEAGINSVVIKKSTATTKNINTLEIAVTAEGSWTDLIKFISYMELLPHRVTISKVDITSFSDEPIKSEIAESATKNWKTSFAMEVLTLKADDK